MMDDLISKKAPSSWGQENGLISRQAAISRAVEIELFGRKVKVVAVSELEALPSAQPEIIMCKDCKFVGTDATCCLVCKREGMGLRPFHVYHDDFCSYAERRTDGQT